MKGSTHKKIIMAGCGCAALLGVVAVIGVVVALLEDPDFLKNEFASEDYFSSERAVAALDSLRAADFGPLRRPPARDPYALRGMGKGNGARAAIRVWTDSASFQGAVAFGDTFPDGNWRRRRWVEAASWDVVDSLRAAALLPWDFRAALADSASPGAGASGVLALRVLSATRAMLARARLADVRGDAGDADTLARAVVTIGRHLQADYRLYHVLLGARVEREALYVLRGIEATRGTDAALRRADDLVAAADAAYRLVTVAGAEPGNCAALADLVRDQTVPLAVRHAAAHAIGFGWALSSREQTKLDARRAATLAELADAALPKDLQGTVEVAQRVVELPLLRRFVVGAQQQFLWRSWRMAG